MRRVFYVISITLAALDLIWSAIALALAVAAHATILAAPIATVAIVIGIAVTAPQLLVLFPFVGNRACRIAFWLALTAAAAVSAAAITVFAF